MAKIKKINVKIGAPSDRKKKYLKPDGGIDLIEKFPKYKDEKKRKAKKWPIVRIRGKIYNKMDLY